MLATGGQRHRLLGRLDSDCRRRHAPAEADRGRPRELDHRHRVRVGRSRRDSSAPCCRRDKRYADALPLRSRRDRCAAPRRRGQADRSLPRGALAGSMSYYTAKVEENGNIAPFVPFLLAFGILGIVMSVLIVANVVGGAVVSGYRRIGILKSIGFTPLQVAAAYAAQVAATRPGRLPGRRRGRQPARDSAPPTERQRLRGRRTRCSHLGRPRGARRDLRPRCGRRPAARNQSRAAQHDPGDRDRTRTAKWARL